MEGKEGKKGEIERGILRRTMLRILFYLGLD